MYDTQPDFQTEIDQLIRLFKNFDKFGFGESEIKDVMDKKREANAKEMRR